MISLRSLRLYNVKGDDEKSLLEVGDGLISIARMNGMEEGVIVRMVRRERRVRGEGGCGMAGVHDVW